MAKKHKGPLTLHPNGQWCKKIGGKLWYFGKDRAEAERRYYEQAPRLHRGQPAKPTGRLTLETLCNLFLLEQHKRVDAGEMKLHGYDTYRRSCTRLLEAMGRDTLADRIEPVDWSALDDYALQFGDSNRQKLIVATRILMKWAYSNGHIERPARFGTYLKLPKGKARKKRSKPRLFEREEILSLLQRTQGTQREAWILLGINGGFGPTDIAGLTIEMIDLDDALIPDYPRSKTGVERAVPLWPETVAALRREIGSRVSGLVFRTSYGNPWVRIKAIRKEGYIRTVSSHNCISAEWKKLGASQTFYALRHTFETVADEALDPHAVSRVMGHELPGMKAVYNERISVARLRRVTNHVRQWLFFGSGTDQAPLQEPVESSDKVLG